MARRGSWVGDAVVGDMAGAVGFAGPSDAYPPETHSRGFVGHAVLGVTSDTGLALLGR